MQSLMVKADQQQMRGFGRNELLIEEEEARDAAERLLEHDMYIIISSLRASLRVEGASKVREEGT